MDINVQTTSHLGLRAWFEVLRTSRNGLMPKYRVRSPYGSMQCSNCLDLCVRALSTMHWETRRQFGSSCLHSFRHHKSCAWRQEVGTDFQSGFTAQPLERAYVYWAQLEYKLNHK